MTRALGYQKEVFNIQEVLEYFRASNYEDCRINAYPSFTKYYDINRTPPTFLMLDVDLSLWYYDYSARNLIADRSIAWVASAHHHHLHLLWDERYHYLVKTCSQKFGKPISHYWFIPEITKLSTRVSGTVWSDVNEKPALENMAA